MVEIQQDDLNPLLNSFSEGICYLNTDGELLYHNEVAQIHWSRERLRSNQLISEPVIARALTGEYLHHDLVHLSKDHVLLVNAAPLHSQTGITKGTVIITHDVTEQVLLEQEARTALDLLQEVVLGFHSNDENAEIDEVLRRIAVLIPQLESVDNSVVFRVDESSRQLIPLALYGANEHSYEEWKDELSGIKLSTEKIFQTSAPAYLQALRLGRTLLFDFSSLPHQSNPRNLRAAIYAPVLLHGKVVGLLGAERHRPLQSAYSYFPQWGVDLLTALARLATMSLEKTVLENSIEHTQEEIKTARTLLSQRDEFLALAAHELKNPLTAIRGQAQVLHRRIQRTLHLGSNSHHPEIESLQTTHELLRGLESIEHQTRKLEHMINTLLDVNRLDLNRLELAVQEFDMTQMVKRTLEEHLPFAGNHELRLFVNGQSVPLTPQDTTKETPIRVKGDERQLEQVLTNLVNNAIKYSPQNGAIQVSLQYTDDRYVELSVADQGIGIPAEEQAHLTQRFYRAENAKQIDSKGLGLGLYLVKEIVIHHGGILSIRSEGAGKGSIFTVRLPM